VRIYVDSSALVKRAIQERESVELIDALDRHQHEGDALLSSSLAWVEVTRVLRSRLDLEPPTEVAQLIDVALSGILEAPITEQVISIARRLGPSTLRSPDAIHLAAATLLTADVICAYDKRLLVAASELGFRTASPSPNEPRL
jgi:predicted nucleic acid-binding protein